VVEGARLESVYTVTPYRGFESRPVRNDNNLAHLGACRGGLFRPKNLAKTPSASLPPDLGFSYALASSLTKPIISVLHSFIPLARHSMTDALIGTDLRPARRREGQFEELES
jgi:hypothetical protein